MPMMPMKSVNGAWGHLGHLRCRPHHWLHRHIGIKCQPKRKSLTLDADDADEVSQWRMEPFRPPALAGCTIDLVVISASSVSQNVSQASPLAKQDCNCCNHWNQITKWWMPSTSSSPFFMTTDEDCSKMHSSRQSRWRHKRNDYDIPVKLNKQQFNVMQIQRKVMVRLLMKGFRKFLQILRQI